MKCTLALKYKAMSMDRASIAVVLCENSEGFVLLKEANMCAWKCIMIVVIKVEFEEIKKKKKGLGKESHPKC